MSSEYRVFIVVDTDYGEHLHELAQSGPVWIVGTSVNREAVQKVWAERSGVSHLEGVTTFDSSAKPPEDALIGVLDAVDLHHGIYSADPPYTALEVIGASATDKVKAEMAEYGFNSFQTTATGFRAVRPLPRALKK